DPQDGRNRSAFAVLTWRTTLSSRFVLTQRAALGLNDYHNVNNSGIDLARGAGRDLIYRSDWTFAERTHVSFDGGGELRSSELHRHDVAVAASGGGYELREQFSAGSFAESAYGQMRLSGAKWSITPGLRVDHWTLTADTPVSPWLQANYQITSHLTLRGGTSLSHPPPTVPPPI